MPMEPKMMVVAMAVVSFHKAERIRVVDGTEELVRVVRSCVENYWHRGLQGGKSIKGVPEFKMYGKPWEPSGTDRGHAHADVCGAMNWGPRRRRLAALHFAGCFNWEWKSTQSRRASSFE
jgi:hypothetical protein